MRKVLFLSGSLSAGGGTRALVNFARHMDRRLFAPTLAGLEGDRELVAGLQSEGFPVVVASGPEGLGKLLESGGFASVVLNRSGRRTGPGDATMRQLAGPGKGALLLERNVFGEPDRGPLAARVDVHLHQSAGMLERYLRLLGEPVTEALLWRQAVMQNPVDLAGIDRARPGEEEVRARRSEWGVPGDAVLVGHVCRPDTEKWQDLHIDMLRVLCRRNPKAFYLAREGPPSRARRIRRASRGRCVLLGFSRNEAEVYRTMACLDVYAHASRIGECFSNALAEAMAMALPVVTLSTPQPKLTNGQIEQVDHGRTGYLADTTGTYVRAVEALVASEEKRRDMGRAGRAKIERDFAPQILTQRLERLMLTGIGGKGAKLSPEEKDLVCRAGESRVSPGDYREMLGELRSRESEVFGPPGAMDRLCDQLRRPLRLLRRIADRRRR